MSGYCWMGMFVAWRRLFVEDLHRLLLCTAHRGRDSYHDPSLVSCTQRDQVMLKQRIAYPTSFWKVTPSHWKLQQFYIFVLMLFNDCVLITNVILDDYVRLNEKELKGHDIKRCTKLLKLNCWQH